MAFPIPFPLPVSMGVVIYKPLENQLLGTSHIWFPDIERELLEHFRRNPKDLYGLPSRKFEELVASIFSNQGFSVELTPASKDGGFDIVAVQNDQFTGTSTYLVECKRYGEENKVGVGIVRSLLGVVDSERATKGVVVTTSFFTRGAKLLEEKNTYRLSLKDYNSVVLWLDQLGIHEKEV